MVRARPRAESSVGWSVGSICVVVKPIVVKLNVVKTKSGQISSGQINKVEIRVVK
jgi:hypothetical protein